MAESPKKFLKHYLTKRQLLPEKAGGETPKSVFQQIVRAAERRRAALAGLAVIDPPF